MKSYQNQFPCESLNTFLSQRGHVPLREQPSNPIVSGDLCHPITLQNQTFFENLSIIINENSKTHPDRIMMTTIFIILQIIFHFLIQWTPIWSFTFLDNSVGSDGWHNNSIF